MRNIWKDGIMGVVTGDALGCPVQFESREERMNDPVTGMREHGTFDLPAGSWTDDSSLTLELLQSIIAERKIDETDIMNRFVSWYEEGDSTPYGYAYDIGLGTAAAIERFMKTGDPYHCGGINSDNNGNGSLMRILPACLYCHAEGIEDAAAIQIIHGVSALTHAHLRAMTACGIYYFISKAVLDESGTLQKRMQNGITRAAAFYQNNPEWRTFHRLKDLDQFSKLSEEQIRSTGYVVDSLEASLWCLLHTDTFQDALLEAVNLGGDTDTIAAIAGGMAGLYYGYEAIPADWINALQRKAWLMELCDEADCIL